MSTTLYRPLLRAWAGMFIALVTWVVVWTVGSLIGMTSETGKELGDFPSPVVLMYLVMVAVLVTILVANIFDRRVFGTIVGVAVLIIVIILIYVLRWVLDTWGSVMLIIMIPGILGVIVGLLVFLAGRKRSEAGVWLVLVIILIFAVLNWIASSLDDTTLFVSSLVFIIAAAATSIGYGMLINSYAFLKKRYQGV